MGIQATAQRAIGYLGVLNAGESEIAPGISVERHHSTNLVVAQMDLSQCAGTATANNWFDLVEDVYHEHQYVDKTSKLNGTGIVVGSGVIDEASGSIDWYGGVRMLGGQNVYVRRLFDLPGIDEALYRNSEVYFEGMIRRAEQTIASADAMGSQFVSAKHIKSGCSLLLNGRRGRILGIKNYRSNLAVYHNMVKTVALGDESLIEIGRYVKKDFGDGYVTLGGHVISSDADAVMTGSATRKVAGHVINTNGVLSITAFTQMEVIGPVANSLAMLAGDEYVVAVLPVWEGFIDKDEMSHMPGYYAEHRKPIVMLYTIKKSLYPDLLF